MHKRTMYQANITLLSLLLLLAALVFPAGSLAATAPTPTLSASVQMGPQVQLSWQQGSTRRSGFEIQRSLNALSGFTTIMTVGSTVFSSVDTTVQTGKSYYYRVRSFRSGKPTILSAWSNVVSADVLQSYDNKAPTVTITNPSAGTSYTTAQTVSIDATAQDNIGVSKVEFYQGGVLKKTATASPYRHAWAIAATDNGSHSFVARAYDAAGNVASSSSVNVTVNIQTAQYTAPVLDYVQASGSDFLLGWSQPPSAYGAPTGGYDIFVDGADTGTTNRTTQQTAVIKGLAAGQHCFDIEARWIQAEPDVFLRSNSLCATSETVVSNPGPVVTDPAPVTGELGPVKVFPFAEGFGTNSKAGRGGQVIKVTNLNDSGPGSLRDAVSKTGPRIVVFEVGGVINLSSSIVITNPNITIAGQSAPAPGITLNGYGIEPGTHDVLIQHLFVRITGTGEDDGMRVYRGSSSAPQIYNVVIDHVSIAWGNDENASIVINSGHDFTYSNCLLGEGHYGMLIDANITNVSILRNLIMSATQRHPRLKGGVTANVVNNVLYNADNQAFAQVGSVDGKNYLSFAGNKFIDGPSTSSGSYGVQVYSAVAGSQLYVPTSGTHKNLASRSVYSSEVTPFLVSSPPSLASLNGITVLPAEEIEVHIYNNAGARPAERDTTYGDTTDERFISELQARVGSVKDLIKPAWSKPVSTVRAFNPGSNPSGDDNGNGYTNIEELLFKMALEVEGRTQ